MTVRDPGAARTKRQPAARTGDAPCIGTGKRPAPCRRRALVLELGALLGFDCHYCERPLDLDDATLDHIWPVCLGGRSGARNLVLACVGCNVAYGADPIKCMCGRCRRVWLPIVQARLRGELRALGEPERRSRLRGGPRPAPHPGLEHVARGSAVQGQRPSRRRSATPGAALATRHERGTRRALDGGGGAVRAGTGATVRTKTCHRASQCATVLVWKRR